MSKTAREWAEHLPEPIRTQFLANLADPDYEERCIADAINGAFFWRWTPQGFDYWVEVQKRADNGEFDIPPTVADEPVARFHKLKKRVLLWAGSRGILDSGTLKGQASKNLEEAAELSVACKNLDALEIVDGIGDNLVTLILTAEMAGLDILDCLEHALGVIEARKGKMQNGVFVKDES